MTVSRYFALLAIALLVFGGGWYFGSTNPGLLTPAEPIVEKATADEISHVVAQGRIVPAGGIYSVIAPPGQLIEQVLVKENDSVIANETRLAILAGEESLKLQTDLADAQSEDVARELDQKILMGESNLLAATSAVKTAKLQLSQAMQSVDLSVSEKQIAAASQKISRMQFLAGDPDTSLYVSQSSLSDQQLKIDQSRSQLETMKRKQAAAIEAGQLGVEVSEKTQAAAETALSALLKLREENKTVEITQQIAQDRRESARIVAPVNGTVLKVFIKEGEAMTNTPLMQIGNLDDMECVAEVVDRLVVNVKKGQIVEITSPALPRPISGTVISIGRFVGGSTMAAPSPLALVDRKTVDVRIKLTGEDNELASQLVNLQVAVEINTNEINTK